MSYSGSFNGYSFGAGARPGASVQKVTGWRENKADRESMTGATRNSISPPRWAPSEVTLVLNLHGLSGDGLSAEIDRALEAFVPMATPLPLTIDGRTKWVVVVDAVPVLSPDWPGTEVSTELVVRFLAEDPVLYDAEQVTVRTWPTESPLGHDYFKVANPGTLRPWARRIWELTLTAHGAMGNPKIICEHPDGSYEEVRFVGLTVADGQTFTISDDLVPRVGSQIVSGYIRSKNSLDGPTSRAPRWPLLWKCDPDDVDDESNIFTVECWSGDFSGSLKVRYTY